MIKQEIGSEFWNVPIDKKNNYFSKEIFWFLSGGNALRAIIKDIKEKRIIKTVSMPSWCCESMILPFIKEGIEVKFYPVFIKNGEFHQDINIESDIIFVMDYFGYTSNFDFSNSNKIVIRDLTHSIFSKKYNDANYYFGSLRKWTGFYTGGFALKNGEWNISMDFVKKNDWYVNLRKKAMKEKLEYLSNQREDKKYLEIFNEAENYLEKTDEIYLADIEDIERAKKLDISFIKNKRCKNVKYLLQNIKFNDKIKPIFSKLKENDVPLFLPVLVKNRDELRKKLIENKIYCPVHWGKTEYHRLNEKTEYVYNHELSIICDQRYDIKDMEKICQIINDWSNLNV